MKAENNKKTDKRVSSLLSAVDRGATAPNRQFMDKLQKQSSAEFLACSADIIKTRRVSSWRAIMNSPITKLAAVVLLIAGVIVGFSVFTGSPDMTSVALGDVKETFLAQPWVHVIYDNGREEWMNIREGKHFYISENGWRFFVDRALNTRLEHSLNSDHILEVTPTTYPEGNVPPWEPRIAWEVMLGFFAEGDSRALGQYTDIERSADTVDGQDMVRFDIYYLDALDNRVLATQIWADPGSRLPIRIRSRLTLALRERMGVEYITGEYDFPDTGPASIFDLGVPSDLKVVSRVGPASTTSTEALQILQAGEKAAQDFPQRYRAIVWTDREPGEIDALYRSGKKLLFFHYFNLDGTKYSDYHIDIPATTTEILAWTVNQIPVEVGVFDGVNVFRRFNVHPRVNVHEQTSVRVYRASTHFLPRWFYLEDDFWPYVYGKEQTLKLIADHPETPTGCVALSDGNAYYFVDPLKDYMSVRTIHIQNENGSQRRTMDITLSDFVQLPSGHWYPQKKRSISYYKIHPLKDPPSPETSENIDIQLLQEKDIPLDLFDGERLLKGAKVETY
jgi:hypothetical protein